MHNKPKIKVNFLAECIQDCLGSGSPPNEHRLENIIR